jgi:hypothetical protein
VDDSDLKAWLETGIAAERPAMLDQARSEVPKIVVRKFRAAALAVMVAILVTEDSKGEREGTEAEIVQIRRTSNHRL